MHREQEALIRLAGRELAGRGLAGRGLQLLITPSTANLLSDANLI